jgi:hypothetical protein
MAKRKAHKKATPHRRRRVGAMGGKTDFNQLLMVIAGAVGANVLEKIIPDNVSGVDLTKYKGAIPVAVGFFLPSMVKAPWAKGLGLGMVAGGGANLLKDAGIIGAITGDETPMIAAYEKQVYLTQGNSAPMISGRSAKYCG